MPEKLTAQVPRALRSWFVIHFIVDLLFALPLMFNPKWMLTVVGWETIDPFTARLVAAALFGIGIESFLGRDAGAEAFRNTLNLKIIWSLSAAAGISLTLIEGTHGRPWFAWVILAVFFVFNLLWIYWRRQLK